jgi:hypothetical protein
MGRRKEEKMNTSTINQEKSIVGGDDAENQRNPYEAPVIEMLGTLDELTHSTTILFSEA